MAFLVLLLLPRKAKRMEVTLWNTYHVLIHKFDLRDRNYHSILQMQEVRLGELEQFAVSERQGWDLNSDLSDFASSVGFLYLSVS